MGVKCERCEFVGPEFPADDLMREIHRGLHELGGRFLEVLDFIVGRAVPVKPLADLDGFDVDRNKAVFRGEVPPGGRIVGTAPELPLVMGGKVVGVSIFDGKGGMRGTVTDPDAIAALRGGGYSISAGPYPVLPPMSIATRPEDWAPEARAIIWPEGKL